jgi:fructose-1,6-bisphosphatase/sedoheptulose 1,7-bisphosphatase-like protein
VERREGRMGGVIMTRWDCERSILDEIEHVAHLTEAAQDQITTLEDLDRLRRCISKLDAVGARLERRMR